MWRKMCIVFFLLITMCAAQEVPEKPTEKLIINLGSKSYVTEVSPTVEMPLNKRVLFVFDCSGSMNTNKIREAMDFMTSIATQPIDSMEFGVLAFDAPSISRSKKKGVYRWPGIPEPDTSKPVPSGWAGLPSQEAVDHAVAWVTKIRDTAGGGTKVSPALKIALAEDRKDMSIILITDGDFDDTWRDVIKVIENGLKTRKAKKLGPTPIMIFGVTSLISSFNDMVMKKISKIGTGGYYLPHEPELKEQNLRRYGPPYGH